MLENVNYTFSSIEEVLMFVDWVTESFEYPTDFEDFLVERLPFLSSISEDNSYVSTTTIDPISLMDEYIEDVSRLDNDADSVSQFDAWFWDIIKGNLNNGNSSVPGTD